MFVALSDDLDFSNRDTKIFGSLIVTLSSICQSFNMSKSANHSDIMRKKCAAICRQLESRIEEFNSYFEGSSDVEINADVPEEYTIKGIMNFINSKYREIDEMSLSYLTEGSYEKLIRDNED
jgi:nitrogenase molybdenum-iron protein alpha/beta subunit